MVFCPFFWKRMLFVSLLIPFCLNNRGCCCCGHEIVYPSQEHVSGQERRDAVATSSGTERDGKAQELAEEEDGEEAGAEPGEEERLLVAERLLQLLAQKGAQHHERHHQRRDQQLPWPLPRSHPTQAPRHHVVHVRHKS